MEKALREYSRTDKKDLISWKAEKITKLQQIELIASFCNNVHRNDSWKKWHRKARLRTIIRQLSMTVANDANRANQQVEVELRKCPTYKIYTTTAAPAMKLFNEDHWNLFRELVHREYNEKRDYAALRARQYDLFLKVRIILNPIIIFY